MLNSPPFFLSANAVISREQVQCSTGRVTLGLSRSNHVFVNVQETKELKMADLSTKLLRTRGPENQSSVFPREATGSTGRRPGHQACAMQDVGKRVVQVNDCRVPSRIWQNGNKNVLSILTHYLLNTFSEGNEAFVDEKFQEAVQVCTYCTLYVVVLMSRFRLLGCQDVHLCNAGVAFTFMLTYSVHVNNGHNDHRLDDTEIQ